MSCDHFLVARAQSLATGAHVHAVAHQATLYQLGCEVLERGEIEDGKRARIIALRDEAETWLRRFIATHRPL